MRTDEVVTGIIMIVIGFGLAFLLQPTINDYESTTGKLSRALDADAQQDYEETVMMFQGSACFGVIGLLVLIVGVAREEKNKTQPQIVVPPPQIIYQQAPSQQQYQPAQQYAFVCSNCGTQVQANWNLCPNCGTPK
jgi:hypothetical protein